METKLTHALLRCCYYAAHAWGNSSMKGEQAQSLITREAEHLDIDPTQALQYLKRAESTNSSHDKLLVALNLFTEDMQIKNVRGD